MRKQKQRKILLGNKYKIQIFIRDYKHILVYKKKYLESYIYNNLQAASNWLCIYPRGFRQLLLYIKKQYNSPVIYITESGNRSVIFYFLG